MTTSKYEPCPRCGEEVHVINGRSYNKNPARGLFHAQTCKTDNKESK